MTKPNRSRMPESAAIGLLQTNTTDQVGVSPQDIDYMPVRGMIKNKPVTQLKPGEAWSIKNMRWYDAAYRTRDGATNIGDQLDDPICCVLLYTNASVGDYIVAATTLGFMIWNGSTWEPSVGPALTATADTYFSMTQWAADMIYANGVDAIGRITPGSLVHSVLTGAPVAMSVTNFGRRIIATNIDNFPERIQWSVANNNNDWVGLGSGYEDLLAAPGGVVDAALVTVPITDEVAMVVRRRSIWSMSRTGFSDAPFSFSRRYSTFGSDSPGSFVLTPIGIIGLFIDDIYVFSDQQPPVSIGSAVRRDVLANANFAGARACYDPFYNEYRLYVPSQDLAGTSKLWRYHITDQRWTYDEFPFPISSVASVFYAIGLTIDQIDEVIDDLDVTVDMLGEGANINGLIMSQYGESGKYVVQQIPGTVDDIPYGALTPTNTIPAIIEFGELTPGTELRRAGLIEVQVEHENGRAITMQVDYSHDRGQNWEQYDQWVLAADALPKVSRFAKYLEATRLTVRVFSTDAAGMVINSIIMRTQVGSKHAH